MRRFGHSCAQVSTEAPPFDRIGGEGSGEHDDVHGRSHWRPPSLIGESRARADDDSRSTHGWDDKLRESIDWRRSEGQGMRIGMSTYRRSGPSNRTGLRPSRTHIRPRSAPQKRIASAR
jgi:hypothetical protein